MQAPEKSGDERTESTGETESHIQTKPKVKRFIGIITETTRNGYNSEVMSEEVVWLVVCHGKTDGTSPKDAYV